MENYNENTPKSFAIHTCGLTKKIGFFSPLTILDDLNLEVKPGEIFGLLGQNGAGKTTTFKLLLGLSSISSGKALLFGRDVGESASREGVGSLPEVVNHPEYLTVRGYLLYHAKLRELPKISESVDASLKRLGMEGAANRLLGHCSKGMRQRVDLSRVLLGETKLILMDEPVSGLDPLGQKLLKEILIKLRNDGITVFLTSHSVGMIEEVCDSVAFLVNGKLKKAGKISEILASEGCRIKYRTTNGKPIDFSDPVSVRLLSQNSEEFLIRISSVKNMGECVSTLVKNNATVLEAVPEKTSLEDVFTSLVNSASEANP